MKREKYLDVMAEWRACDNYTEPGEHLRFMLLQWEDLVNRAYRVGYGEGYHDGTLPEQYYMETSKIWIDYYHKLTGRDDKPDYTDGCLFHWIYDYAPKRQTDILDICYHEGFKAGQMSMQGGDAE